MVRCSAVFYRGVAGKTDAVSVKRYHGAKKLNQFEFIWNPLEDAAAAVQNQLSNYAGQRDGQRRERFEWFVTAGQFAFRQQSIASLRSRPYRRCRPQIPSRISSPNSHTTLNF